MSAWPLVPLGEVLTKSEDWVVLEPERQYNEVTIRLWGKGVVLRRQVIGAEIASDRRLRVRANQFILSRIDARNGAIGLVPESLDGAVVSTDFPTYALKAERVIPTYLGWMSRTPAFVEICKKASEGTTNRVRLQEDRFLKEEIPLPPLPEQRRIVARIEALSTKIEEGKGLRQQAVQDEERLLICMAHREDLSTNEKLRSGWYETSVGNICRFTDESESVDGSRSYPNLGIFSYGRGVFPKPSIEGAATSAQTLRRVRAGQFIYSRLFAFEGAYAMVPPELDSYYVSGEYPTFTCDPMKTCAEFLWAHFRSPNVWQTVAVGSKGLGHRRQRVQPERVLEYRLWVPPMEWQRKIQSVQAKVDALKKLQSETADELAALLPSILDKAFKGEL